MRPFQVRLDLEGEERRNKAKVCYREGDTEQKEGRSVEITVYVDPWGLRLQGIFDTVIRRAGEFLRRIFNDTQGRRERGAGKTGWLLPELVGFVELVAKELQYMAYNPNRQLMADSSLCHESCFECSQLIVPAPP